MTWHLFVEGLGFTGFALSLNRLILGVFFLISGYHKLFNVQRHATIDSTMVQDHIPAPHVMAWIVPCFEFAGGLALTVGLLAPLAAVSLAVICFVAICSDGMKRLPTLSPLNRADWLADLFYLPETLYTAMLLVVIFAGGGPASLDYLVSTTL